MTEIENRRTSVNNQRTPADFGANLTQEVQGAFLRIETSNGFTVLADTADFEILTRYNWHGRKGGNTAYAYGRIPSKGRGYGSGKIISMHRFLMRPDPDLVVHHRNGNGLDNRRENLQITTTRVNIRHAHIDLKCTACSDPIDEWWSYCAMCGHHLAGDPLWPEKQAADLQRLRAGLQ